MSSSCVAPAQATTGPHRVASVPGSVARFMKEQWPGWAEGQAHTQRHWAAEAAGHATHLGSMRTGGGVICFFLRGRSEFVQRFSCVTPETCAMPRIAYHCGRIGTRRPSHRMMDIFRQRTGFSIQSDLRSHTAEITASARGRLPSHTGPSPETGVPEPPPMRTLSPCGRCPHPSQLWRGQGTGSRGSRVILQTSVPHKNRKHT